MKYEWRKKEKDVYLPKSVPQLIQVKEYSYISLRGKGSPESDEFVQCIEALYKVAYTIKMTLKRLPDLLPGYNDWTVYPLEGIWDITEEAKADESWRFNKKDLVYTLMIRQPEFVTEAFFQQMKALACEKADNPFVEKVQFQKIEDGLCLQMLHKGAFDGEEESFKVMEAFAEEEGYERLSKTHREIYLSDFRRTKTDNLKTVLRFKVKRMP